MFKKIISILMSSFMLASLATGFTAFAAATDDEVVITKEDIRSDILEYRGGFFAPGGIYSEQNYKDYHECYDKAQEVYDNLYATQQEINEAYNNFMNVVNNLEIVGGNAAPYLKGDVDEDGEVTIKDAAAVQLALADGKSHGYVFCNHADVNNDRTMNIIDAALIQLYKARLLSDKANCVAGEYDTQYYYACEIVK